MQTRPPSVPISPETLSQAGAGALLVALAVVELWLAFWAAGWWQRGGACLVAIAGATLVARAVAAVAPPLHVKLRRRSQGQASRPPLTVPRTVGLAEVAQR